MAFGQLVHHAHQRLREWLEAYKPGVGGRLPSERALARELGVQHYAINRAMARLVAEGVVERRGYKLFAVSSERSVKHQGFHCDLVISKRSIYAAGWRRVARELDIDLSLHPWQSAEESLSLLHQLSGSSCESVVFSPPFIESSNFWDPVVGRFAKQGIPVVFINHHCAGVSSVSIDNRRGLDLLFRHLVELGHRQMGFAFVAPWASPSSKFTAQWRSLCLKNDLMDSVQRIYLNNDPQFLAEDAARLVARLGKEWRKVTAWIAMMDNEQSAQRFLHELGIAGISVPERLSLAFLGDHRVLQTASPPMTALSIDHSLQQETAFLLAGRAVRRKSDLGILPPTCEVRILPQMIIRQSCAVIVPAKLRSGQPSPPAPVRQEARLAEVSSRAEDFMAIRSRPYDLTAKVSGRHFSSIDLGSHVNRPLNFRRGWLGDLPLRQFPPGSHIFHGVPFDVLGGNRRSDCGAVVFQSLTNTTGNARKLPSSLRVPIRQKAAAIYFLHGCGYAKYLSAFATYTFYSGKQKLGEVPLIALGRPPTDISPSALQKAVHRCNIQDWWPDYPHYEFSHARAVPLLETKGPDATQWHVFLYTLEWVNPSPQTPVTHVMIESNREQPTTLGLLSITALRA